MNDNKIKIIGAKENNLKNITVEIPKNSLVVFSGVSGSGKTTLAFDTLYKEGQRRYIESLSSYARQFLGSFEKPLVDKIEGLSPSISIDQKTRSNNPRSTVGTVTEIYDFLRLLYANISHPFDKETGCELFKYSIQDVVNFCFSKEINSKLYIGFPYLNNFKHISKIKDDILKKGFKRGIADDTFEIDFENDDLKNIKDLSNIKVIVDRLILNIDNKSRIYEAIELCYKLSNGFCFLKINDEIFRFNEEYNFSNNDLKIKKEPRLFSFNTPLGACPSCNGLGYKKDIDLNLFLDFDKSLLNGIIPFKNAESSNLYKKSLKAVCEFLNLDIKTKIKDIPKDKLDIILYNDKKKIPIFLTSSSGNVTRKNYEGIITNFLRRYMETQSTWIRDWLEKFMSEKTCTKCHGDRLNDAALSFKINGKSISDVCNLSIDSAIDFFNNLKLTKTEEKISESILVEIKSRLNYLKEVGLSYLTLSRKANTLSGGEAQRIRLATQIGSNLSGVIYVLDEPSIGLHQKDNERLIKTLKQMRNLNNTVCVVEHDEETIMASDYVIDIGPKAGIYGGDLVFCGTPDELLKCKDSETGLYLSGQKSIKVPKRRKVDFKKVIKIKNAHENNLKNIDIEIPQHVLNVITGVSGSGKSSLIHDVLLSKIKSKVNKTNTDKDNVDEVLFKGIKKVIEISQDPIGKTPRSNPATYTGVFDDIRDIFALTKLARERGYDKGRFSFNIKGGRCESCRGDGENRISMHFLPDVFVKCETCHGRKYNDETLQVKYKDKSIYDVLEMPIDNAYEFFKDIPKIENKLKVLKDVGVGYLKLGQIAPTLSGGEAQRVKLASELYKTIASDTLYILDEPTTGLHPYDVNNLLKVLQKIVDKGATMIIIEHNLDVIKSADYIIDLGPEGGNLGGEIVAKGSPEEVAMVSKSYTGKYLKKILKL